MLKMLRVVLLAALAIGCSSSSTNLPASGGGGGVGGSGTGGSGGVAGVDASTGGTIAFIDSFENESTCEGWIQTSGSLESYNDGAVGSSRSCRSCLAGNSADITRDVSLTNGPGKYTMHAYLRSDTPNVHWAFTFVVHWPDAGEDDKVADGWVSTTWTQEQSPQEILPDPPTYAHLAISNTDVNPDGGTTCLYIDEVSVTYYPP
jgi:hypothetical protein